MSPTHKDRSPELDSLHLMWKSSVSATDTCENGESDSWTSDGESVAGGGGDTRKNSFYDDQAQGYLDSGFEDNSNDRHGNGARSRATEKKIQSILRAEPQVFKVYDKKERKSRKGARPEPRKSVGFIFPEGMKIPERVSNKRTRAPIRHLKVLQRKLKGELSVPWRQSAHTLGKARPLNPIVLTVDEKSKSGAGRHAVREVTLGDLKIQRMKPSEFEYDDEDEETDASDAESGENNVNGNESNEDEDEDSRCDNGDENSGAEGNNDGEQDNEELQMSRRKALRYALKNVQLSNTPPKKSVRRVASFPTAGRGVGRARRHYPHAQNHAHHQNHHTHSAPSSPKKEVKKEAIPSVIISPPTPTLEVQISSNLNPNPDTAIDLESEGKPKSRRSSSQSSLQDRVLDSISRLFDQPSPTPAAADKPGRIVRTRYRSVAEIEPLPSIE